MKTYLTGFPNREEAMRLKDLLQDHGHETVSPFDLLASDAPFIDAQLARLQAVLDVAQEEGRIVLPRKWGALDLPEWEHVSAELATARKAKMPIVWAEELPELIELQQA